MSITYTVLQFLEMNRGKYISGGDIASYLGVSRNSVWKAVKTLKDEGYNIDAVTNKGYMLSQSNSKFSSQSIGRYITDSSVRVEYFDSVTSTNTVLKQRAEGGEEEGLLLVSAEQTAGKGRRGRSFVSRRGSGVYFSLLLRPSFNAEDALLITTCAAVAAAKAIERHSGIDVKIKWVNDLYRNDRKICGILTEASVDMEGGKLDYAVLGIGINTYISADELPDELKNIVGSVFDTPDVNGDTISKIVADTVNFFMEDYRKLEEKSFLDEYRSRSFLEGKKVVVSSDSDLTEAEVLGIDDDFHLVVRYPDGLTQSLYSGEVSVKLK